jgi:hypothetical protein
VLATDLEEDILFAFHMVRKLIHESLYSLPKIKALFVPARLKDEEFQGRLEVQ